jgi:hypothetical protein
LVARLPPIVQLPSAARLSAKRRPCAAASSWTRCSTQPASTTIVRLARSTLRIRFSRAVESRTWLPLSSGTDAPTSPVLPPCGTSDAPCSRHAATTPATSAVDAGRTTASARPK